jgi:hypothetical protein
MAKKLEMSSFHTNLNHKNMPLVDPDVSQIVHKGLH